MLNISAEFFEDWRESARALALAEVPPEDVRWADGRARKIDGQADLFGCGDDVLPAPTSERTLHVPSVFLATAKTVSHHRDAARWDLLYRILWRMQHGERHVMNIASDDDVVHLTKLEKAVRRDGHKMKAFVRFREVTHEGDTCYLAWHRPDHYALRFTADFFVRRFDVMRWTIMTPDETASWDGSQLVFSPGMPKSAAKCDDEMESLWKTYYAHIFNPARIKLKAMQAEMPKKHWPTMPETELIDQMLRDAPKRVEAMLRYTDGIRSASTFVPEKVSLTSLRAAAKDCAACDLCEAATQTVFGIGPPDASLVLIGEQPGDEEDISGTPFVGPAGTLLDSILEEVGIDRQSVYITNAVKHFKFARSGKRRLHKTPSAREVAACRPWLVAELETIRPTHIVCLGATAAKSVFGPNFRITRDRGKQIDSDFAPWAMATFHPSAVLRSPDPEVGEKLTEDLRLVAASLSNATTS
ncbi:MAG: UdgX family uracil-DNA binding protein [Planctomycetota bacterium]